MVTSPSESTSHTESEPIEDVSPDPTEAEAVAIAAAIDAHLAAEHVLAEEEESASWAGEGWRFAGRFEQLQGHSVRPREPLPRDPWRAADRTRRL